jgi:excisionase family DNA binding protein
MEDVVMPQAETCLTIKDVCQQLKCSKESVYGYVKAGKLNATFRLGNRLRFFQKDVDAFVQRQANPTPGRS